LLATFFIAEKIALTKGFKPWKLVRPSITIYPGGKFYQKHPKLGYTHLPGQFIVTMPTGYFFKVTHSADTLRITHEYIADSSQNEKDEIWIFGCSITHGWSINDNETYPWVLQSQLPEYEIVNFGVSGYGTLHSLIQLQEALSTRKKKPKIAVLAYDYIHDARNTFLRKRRKIVAPYNFLGPSLQPYARITGDGRLKIKFAKVDYRPFPLMEHSAFIHMLEEKYNAIEDRFYNSHKVTKAIIEEFIDLSRRNNITPVVASFSRNQSTYDILMHAYGLGVVSGDISVDMFDSRNVNMPHDGHPTAYANEQFADKLLHLLESNKLL
jgi:hypothetical protein